MIYITLLRGIIAIVGITFIWSILSFLCLRFNASTRSFFETVGQETLAIYAMQSFLIGWLLKNFIQQSGILFNSNLETLIIGELLLAPSITIIALAFLKWISKKSKRIEFLPSYYWEENRE